MEDQSDCVQAVGDVYGPSDFCTLVQQAELVTTSQNNPL